MTESRDSELLLANRTADDESVRESAIDNPQSTVRNEEDLLWKGS